MGGTNCDSLHPEQRVKEEGRRDERAMEGGAAGMEEEKRQIKGVLSMVTQMKGGDGDGAGRRG